MASSPHRVLYLLHDARRSGVPAVAATLIRAADAAGVAPTVLFAYDGVYAAELAAQGIPVRTLGKRTPLLWRAKRFLMNYQLLTIGRDFELVHVHSVTMAASVLVAHALGLKVVFHLHELPRRVNRVLGRALAVADEIVFCSETCASHFAALGYPRGRTIVNALFFPEIPPVEHREENRRVVVTASINRNKGQDLVLEAFARLRENRAELWLYGTVGLSARGFVARLKERARELGVEERVHFPGPSLNVLQVFSEAAVMVHASWTESFGMALVEAMSCGIPVIAHDLEGMREVVADAVTGYLVPPGDVELLASRLDALLADPTLRSALGAQGYRKVRERFDIRGRIADYARLYRELAQTPPQGDRRRMR